MDIYVENIKDATEAFDNGQVGDTVYARLSSENKQIEMDYSKIIN
jgi:hypothetical protein